MTVENISIDVKTNAGDAARQVRSLSSALAGVRNAGKSVANGGTQNSVSRIGSAAKTATKHTGNLLSSIKRIAMYRLLRTALKEVGKAFDDGLKNAYQFSKGIDGTLAEAMDSLATKSLTMKNQLGAAFGNLLTAITPILLQIINLVRIAAQALSALFSALGGGQYLIATDVAQSWDKATGAAKKYKNTILGFDEINRLDEPSGGGGGSAIDASKMFEVGELPEWANKIKEEVDRIKEAFNDWWNDPSGEKFWKLLASISQLLTDIGKKIIGLSFDNVIIPFGTFLDKMGQSFGMDFNIETNLTQLRDDLVSLLDAVQGFMDDPTWENFSVILRDIANIVDTIVHFVGDIAFEPLIKVAEGVDAIGAAFGKDWKVAETLRKWKKAFDEFDLVTWWDTKVKPWIADFDLKRDILNLFGLPEDWSIAAEWESITQFFKELPNNIWTWIQSIPNNIKELFNAATSNIKAWKEELFNWAKEQIPKLSSDIGEFFNNLPERIGYWIGVAKGTVMRWKIELLSWAAENLPKAAEEIGNYFEDMYNAVKNWFDTALDKIKGWKDEINAWADKELPGLAQDIADFFAELPSKLWDIGAKMITGLWDGLKSQVDWLGSQIKGLFGADGSISRLFSGYRVGLNVGLNGGDFNIPAKASGGSIENNGSLFIAGEAGPEIVADMGSRTGVMNVDQMEAAVANGNIGVINAVYAMANAIVTAVNSIDTDITLDGESVADKLYRPMQNAANRYGAAMVT